MPATRYVALLRAINVGGHTVPMATLKKLFEDTRGCTNVSTFIASGNVLFDSATDDAPALEARIGAELERALGYEVVTFVRTPKELQAIAAHEPFSAADMDTPGVSLYVMFLPKPLSPKARAALTALETPCDRFHVRGREIFWLVRGKLLDSQVKGPQMARAIGMPTTMRNITSVRKLAALSGLRPGEARPAPRRKGSRQA